MGVERISDLKSYQLESRSKDDFIDEIFVNQIIVHPDYVCGKPENDLGKEIRNFLRKILK